RPALDAYLSGEAPAAGLALQRAAYPGSVLTPSQRHAAERFLGSPLCAVQGPPGTGKTTLILHLAAEHILEQVDDLVDHGTMGDALMSVASTNNRAVDNVIEPLNLDPALDGEGLPLALRTGSREVCEKVTARQIRDAMAWVGRHRGRRKVQDVEAEEALKAALATYKDLRERLLEGDAARAAELEQWTRRARVQRELAATNKALVSCGVESESAPPVFSRADLKLAKRALAALEKLSKLAGARASPKALRRLEREHAKFQREIAEKVQTLCGRMAPAAPWPLPFVPKQRSVERVMEGWEDAIEQCVDGVEDLIDAMSDARKVRDLVDQRDRLMVDLKELETDDPENTGGALKASGAELEPLRAQLFVEALAVRRAWAMVHAVELYDALEVAAKVVASERSMRSLFRAENEAGRWLRRLCGVWGCTLLSMANAVPAESKGLRRVVIDEAGQCHPAHAISALMRCRSALVIGDVCQLEPVVGLGQRDEGRVQAQANVRLSGDLFEPYRVFSESRNSVQSLADRAVGGPLRLADHFRCQPPIIAICDELCGYGLTIHTPPASRAAQVPCLRAPVLFMEVEGQQERLGGSWVNHGELETCMELLETLMRAGIGSEEVAIITPYRGQLELLQRGAARRSIPIARGLKSEEQMSLFGGSSGEQGLTLGTVHRFQGGERSIVIFSSVVTEARSLGFLNNRPNLLNVTISRAREHLVTLGHRAALSAGRYTHHLVHGDSNASAGVLALEQQ
ncbi:MAG: AAA domain-containing protein, partial [Myxococcales bacterium]|nr:AAA domain-containing protein [Myxococcales bacterium]